MQARKAYNFLVENLSHDWQVSSQVWKFEVLSVPELREMAAKDAAMADLIIVSSHGRGEWPAHVQAWVEMWQGDKRGPVALLALLNGSPELAERARVAQAYLEEVARRRRMEFSTWPQAWPEQAGSPERAIVNRRWEMTGETPFPIGALAPRDQSFFHRGINP